MPRAVERFLKVNEVVEELKLVLQVFLYDDSVEVEDLFYCATFSSESSLLFRQQFLNHTFQSVEDEA